MSVRFNLASRADDGAATVEVTVDAPTSRPPAPGESVQAEGRLFRVVDVLWHLPSLVCEPDEQSGVSHVIRSSEDVLCEVLAIEVLDPSIR